LNGTMNAALPLLNVTLSLSTAGVPKSNLLRSIVTV